MCAKTVVDYSYSKIFYQLYISLQHLQSDYSRGLYRPLCTQSISLYSRPVHCKSSRDDGSSALSKGRTTSYCCCSCNQNYKLIIFIHTKVKLAYLNWSILTVCRLQQHQLFPRGHYTLYPTHHCDTPQHDLPMSYFLTLI